MGLVISLPSGDATGLVTWATRIPIRTYLAHRPRVFILTSQKTPACEIISGQYDFVITTYDYVLRQYQAYLRNKAFREQIKQRGYMGTTGKICMEDLSPFSLPSYYWKPFRPPNLGSSIPAQHFGKNAKGIILIRDEDPKELEVNGWIPLTKMEHANKIQGIIVCGDLAQLRGTVLSATDVPGWNEFCLQLETPYAARLVAMRHPVLKLTEQRRFRPVFAEWLNHRVYGNEMFCHLSTRDIKVSQKWDSMIRSAFSLNRYWIPGIKCYRVRMWDRRNLKVKIQLSACWSSSWLDC